MILRQFSTQNASVSLYPLQSLALSKKRSSIIKVKCIPSSQHTPTPFHCFFSNTNRAGISTTHTSNSSYTHPPSSAQHSDQLISSKRKQLEGCRMKDSQQQGTLTNLWAWQTWTGLSSSLLCRGFTGSSRAAKALAESETLLLHLSSACPSSCLGARALSSTSHSLAEVVYADKAALFRFLLHIQF